MHVTSSTRLVQRLRDIVEPSELPKATEPVAVVAVHGISPIQRYAFQDQFAGGLQSYLNACEEAMQSGRRWLSTVYWPKVQKGEGEPVLRPSALRLYRDDEPNPETPNSRVYDVYEGYWSPYSKGKTTARSLLGWLFACSFLATSSTANIPASWKKTGWDVGYLLAAIVLAIVTFLGGLLAGVTAWGHYAMLFGAGVSCAHPPCRGLAVTSIWEWLSGSPLSSLAALPLAANAQLVFGVSISYLLAQLFLMVHLRFKTAGRTERLCEDATEGSSRFARRTVAAGTFHRWASLACLAGILGLIGIDLLWLHGMYPGREFRALRESLFLVLAVALLTVSRAIADFIVENVLGDVQIYTTYDSNSGFYVIRQDILKAVTTALLGPLNAVNADGERLYGKIHVAGHSLGSTIGLDVLIRLRQLVQEDAIDAYAWSRIRSFTTFGTALEKTRFFFEVRHPTVSAAQHQWENDVYGRFFTQDVSTLAQSDNADGVYWSNLWYWRDIVANAIVSYASDVPPGIHPHFSLWKQSTGSHPICVNHEIPHDRPFWTFVHGDYIADPLFWKHAGPIMTS